MITKHVQKSEYNKPGNIETDKVDGTENVYEESAGVSEKENDKTGSIEKAVVVDEGHVYEKVSITG